MFGHRKEHKRGIHRPRRHPKGKLPERAWMQFTALRIIHEEPMHGYKIIDELESRGYVEANRLRSGSTYIILKRMERNGWLTSERANPSDRRSPRVYSITEKGTRELEEGLKYILEKQTINAELIDYYRKNFVEEST